MQSSTVRSGRTRAFARYIKLKGGIELDFYTIEMRIKKEKETGEVFYTKESIISDLILATMDSCGFNNKQAIAIVNKYSDIWEILEGDDFLDVNRRLCGAVKSRAEDIRNIINMEDKK